MATSTVLDTQDDERLPEQSKLTTAATDALQEAKEQGRDRVVLAPCGDGGGGAGR